MESDKHYFFEGLFIIVFSIAATIFAVWLGSPGHHDDVLYRDAVAVLDITRGAGAETIGTVLAPPSR